MKIKFLLSTLFPSIFLGLLSISAMEQTDEISAVQKLYGACFHQSVTDLQALIRSGIDINAEEGFGQNEEIVGFTALHMAAYYGLDSAIPKLLASGANINKTVRAPNKLAGMTALQLGIYRNILPVVCILLKNGASIHGTIVSTNQCFKYFVGMEYSSLSKDIPMEFAAQPKFMQHLTEIIQRKVINMANTLAMAGLKFDKGTKSYVLHTLRISLDNPIRVLQS
jgi:ankyrin repeat protein